MSLEWPVLHVYDYVNQLTWMNLEGKYIKPYRSNWYVDSFDFDISDLDYENVSDIRLIKKSCPGLIEHLYGDYYDDMCRLSREPPFLFFPMNGEVAPLSFTGTPDSPFDFTCGFDSAKGRVRGIKSKV